MKTEAAAPARNVILDLARLIAAFGVITIHCSPTTPGALAIVNFFLNFCVPFFLLTSLFFFWAELNRTQNPTRALLNRWRRLWRPYLCWTAIYLGARLGKFFLRGQPTDELLNPTSLVMILGAGTGAVQLYFLPLLAFALGLAWLLAVGLGPIRRTHPWWIGTFFLVSSLLLFVPFDSPRVNVSPLRSLAFVYADWMAWVLPTILLAAGLALIFGGSWRRRAGLGWGLLFCALALNVAIVGEVLPFHWRFGSLVLATLVLSCAFTWKPAAPPRRWSQLILGTSFGVFLSHHLFVELIEAVDHAQGGALTQPYSFASLLLVAAVVMGISVLFTLAVQRHALLRRYLLGQ